MKRLFKWFFRLFLALVLLVLLLILFLDPIAKYVAERQIRQQTGLDVMIGKVSIGLREPTLSIEKFKLFNSAEFGDAVFIDVPELRVQYDLEALRARKIRLNLVRLNLAELHIVQNKDGKTNLRALQERQKQNKSGSGSGSSAAEFQAIDTLRLTIGKLKFTSEKNPGRNEEAYVGIKNETVKNVSSLKDLQPFITRIALEKNLKSLTEELGGQGTNLIQSASPSTVKEAQKTLDGVSGKTRPK